MRKINRLKSVLLCISMLIALLSLNAAAPQQAFASGKTHYIAVASDRHENTNAIYNAMSGMPDSVEYVCLNGDMANFAPRPGNDQSGGGQSDGQPPTGGASGSDGSAGDSTKAPQPHGERAQSPYNTETVLSEIQKKFPHIGASEASIVYANHDANATDDAGIMKNADTSQLPAAEGRDRAEISEGQSGLIYAGEDGSYYVYGISYMDMRDAAAAARAAAEFRDWADSVDPAVPVIVVSHVPIHAERHDNHGGSVWNKALNYASTGSDSGTEIVRDVVFFHGHNHAHGRSRESTEHNFRPGEKITAEGDSEESVLYYSYITSGYLNFNCTASLIAIDDEAVTFTKYRGDPAGEKESVPELLHKRDRVKYYNVSFDGRGGSSTDPQSLLKGRSAARPSDPSRDGYTFTGWYRDKAAAALYDFSTAVTADITLYAGWKKNKTVPPEGGWDDEKAVPGGTERKEAAGGTEQKTVEEDSARKAGSPKTGDDGSMLLWQLLMLVSSAELAVLLFMRRRQL